MRVLVVGGTGRTGRRIVDAAREAGHEPVVLGRSASADVVGDVLDPEVIDRAVAGVDAVVSALSIPRTSRSPFAPVVGPTDLHSRATAGLLAAMARHGVPRFVKVSAQGVGSSAPRAGWAFRALVAVSNLAPAFADHAVADDLVQASDRDWTIVRPPMLVDAPPNGGVRAGEDLVTGSTTRVATGDVAEFVVAALDDPAWSRRCVTLTPGSGQATG